MRHRGAEGPEFLVERDRNGVHQVRARGFDDPGKLPRLAPEGLGERLHLPREPAADRDRGHVEGGREGVVGGLAEVDVVVGVDHRAVAAGGSQDLRRPSGEDFVHVHVEGGPRPGLVDVHHELLRVPPGQHLVAGLPYGRRLPASRRPEAARPPGFLDPRVGADHLGMGPLARDRIVLHGARGLRAPVGVVGDLPGAEAVPLFSQVVSSGPPTLAESVSYNARRRTRARSSTDGEIFERTTRDRALRVVSPRSRRKTRSPPSRRGPGRHSRRPPSARPGFPPRGRRRPRTRSPRPRSPPSTSSCGCTPICGFRPTPIARMPDTPTSAASTASITRTSCGAI